MDIRLVVEKGNTQIRTLCLRAGPTVIGRQQGCNLRIPSAEVSRRHCVLCVQDGYLTAEDLGSANGTILNGRRIKDRAVVRPGDHLEIGPLQFVVEYELTPTAVERLRSRAPGTGRAVQASDDLPVAEEVFDGTTVEEPVDVLPVEDKPVAPNPAQRNNEVIPLTANFDDEDWQLPQSGELRDILAQLEESKHAKTRRR